MIESFRTAMNDDSYELNIHQKNYSISLIRFIALIFIITCHIMQKLSFELAWWFNVGVQIFLCISGFLYGQKNFEEITSFYSRRFRKILIPYFIVFIPYGILQFLFAKDIFNLRRFIKGLFVNATLNGAGHLWFVHTILICYVLIPLLSIYRDKYVRSRKSFLLFSFLSVELTGIFFRFFNAFYNPAWIICFIAGYILGINEIKLYINRNLTIFLIGIAALVGNSIQIYYSYVIHSQFAYYESFCNFNHVTLGIFLFLVMKTVFDKMNLHKISGVLSLTDYYGYEMYLTHHFIILGPFSLMGITKIIWLNILIILGLTVIFAVLVKKSTKAIESLIIVKNNV